LYWHLSQYCYCIFHCLYCLPSVYLCEFDSFDILSAIWFMIIIIIYDAVWTVKQFPPPRNTVHTLSSVPVRPRKWKYYVPLNLFTLGNDVSYPTTWNCISEYTLYAIMYIYIQGFHHAELSVLWLVPSAVRCTGLWQWGSHRTAYRTQDEGTFLYAAVQLWRGFAVRWTYPLPTPSFIARIMLILKKFFNSGKL
jgi:hypothetical protein